MTFTKTIAKNILYQRIYFVERFMVFGLPFHVIIQRNGKE
jgi:hypothetical protein